MNELHTRWEHTRETITEDRMSVAAAHFHDLNRAPESVSHPMRDTGDIVDEPTRNLRVAKLIYKLHDRSPWTYN
jgi:hypothetical protein